MTSDSPDTLRRARLIALATLADRLGDVSVARHAVDRSLARTEEFGADLSARVLAEAWRSAGALLQDDHHERARTLLKRLGPVPPTIGAEEDQIRLLFACCHSTLPQAVRIALTLSLFSGLTSSQLALVFATSESTMALRLERAELRLRPRFEPPRSNPEPPVAPLVVTLGVIMVIFDNGYVHAQHHGPGIDLPAEAIQLARTVVELFPCDPEARALLALMLVSHARRDVHRAADGSVVPVGTQDRARWHHTEINEGLFHLRTSLKQTPAGPYGLLASIQAAHVETLDPDDTDWPRILSLYDQLLQTVPSDEVCLNRISALAHVHGPSIALREVDRLDLNTHLSHATRADLLDQEGRHEEAGRAWATAVALSRGAPENTRWRDHTRRSSS